MVFTNSKKPFGNLLLYKQILVFCFLFFVFVFEKKEMMQMKYSDENKPFYERNYVRDWSQDFEILFKLYFIF